MTAILLVVGDAATPTAGDSQIETWIEDLGYTVTLRSDETAENVAGFDGVVITESCASATLGTKYNAVSIPVIDLEQGHWDEMRFCASSDISQTDQTSVTWDDLHPINDGPFGTFTLGNTNTIYPANISIGWIADTGLASGMTKVAFLQGNTGNITAGACEAGAALTSGNAEGKRAFMWPKDAGVATLDSDGQNSFKNALYWAFEPQEPFLAWVYV